MVVRVSASEGVVTVEGGERDPLLTAKMAGEAAGMTAGAWRGLVSSGAAPVADDPGDLEVPANRRSPKWRLSSVARYVAGRRRPRRGSLPVVGDGPDTP